MAGFRPEAVRPPEEVEEPNRLHGTVETAEALGHERIVYFKAGVEPCPPRRSGKREETAAENGPQEGCLVARLPPGQGPGSGEHIELGIDADQAYLFTETGEAL